MDGISVAASIVGLIGVATKVALGLNEFIDRVKNGPILLMSLQNEINDTSICLRRIQALLLDSAAVSASNSSLLMVEDIVVVLSNCVLIFSELEAAIDALKRDHSNKASRVYEWVTKKDVFNASLTRLRSSKLSLNLALSTMTCSSMAEARTCVSQLTKLVHDVLESNHHISERLALMETKLSNNRSIEAHSMAESTLKSYQIDDDESVITVRERVTGTSSQIAIDSVRETRNLESDIEGLLSASRPYIRALNKPPLPVSANCSAVQSIGWSFFSGISLTEVSNISVIELAVDTSTVWNAGRYTLNQIPAIRHSQTAVLQIQVFNTIPPWSEYPILVKTSAALASFTGSVCQSCSGDESIRLTKTALLTGRMIMFHRRFWHENCFACSWCAYKIPVEADCCYLVGSEAKAIVCDFCVPRCKECSNVVGRPPIADEAFTCLSCAICRNCNKVIGENGRVRTPIGILCTGCFESTNVPTPTDTPKLEDTISANNTKSNGPRETVTLRKPSIKGSIPTQGNQVFKEKPISRPSKDSKSYSISPPRPRRDMSDSSPNDLRDSIHSGYAVDLSPVSQPSSNSPHRKHVVAITTNGEKFVLNSRNDRSAPKSPPLQNAASSETIMKKLQISKPVMVENSLGWG